jgi:hypothetical protein
MATIKEDYVSFEVAKLLNDKGFNEPTLAYAYGNDMINYYSRPRITDVINIQAGRIPMPTLQMAMKWLRKVYNIDISIIPLRSQKEYLPRIESDTISHDAIPCKEHEKAAEVAIKYCLENLI